MAARSVIAAGLLALAMLFCGVVHHFAHGFAVIESAVAMPGLTFGWAAYLVTFWRHMHRPVAQTEDETELAA